MWSFRRHVFGAVNDGWTVAQTMLVYERGGGTPMTVGLAPGERTLAPDLVDLLRRVGRDQDPVARQAVARAHINDFALAHLGRRLSRRLAGSETPNPAVAAYGKLASGTYAPIRARIAIEIGGPDGAVVATRPGRGRRGGPQLPEWAPGRNRLRHQRDAAQRHRRAGARPAEGTHLRLPEAVLRGRPRGPEVGRTGGVSSGTLTPDKLQAATVALMGAERRLRARDQQGRHLTSSQLRALFALDGKDAVPAGQLARAADLNPATITAMLDSLARNGIIERHPDPDDRRVILVSLTEAGQDLMAERRERWFALWHEHLGDLSPEELDFAVDVIRRVTRVIGNL